MPGRRKVFFLNLKILPRIAAGIAALSYFNLSWSASYESKLRECGQTKAMELIDAGRNANDALEAAITYCNLKFKNNTEKFISDIQRSAKEKYKKNAETYFCDVSEIIEPTIKKRFSLRRNPNSLTEFTEAFDKSDMVIMWDSWKIIDESESLILLTRVRANDAVSDNAIDVLIDNIAINKNSLTVFASSGHLLAPQSLREKGEDTEVVFRYEGTCKKLLNSTSDYRLKELGLEQYGWF